MADERAERRAKLLRAMAKMTAEGREREFAALSEAYEALRREQAEVEQREAARARRAARAAVRPVEAPKRWKLPAGFGMSPLARERAREGRPEVPVIPVGRRVLSPRRRGSLMSERVWRP